MPGSILAMSLLLLAFVVIATPLESAAMTTKASSRRLMARMLPGTPPGRLAKNAGAFAGQPANTAGRPHTMMMISVAMIRTPSSRPVQEHGSAAPDG